MVEQVSLPDTPLTPLNKGEFKEAGDKFKSAISIFEELKQPFEIAKAYYYYAQSIKTVGTGLVPVQFDDTANEYLQKAKEIFEKVGAKAWLAKIRKM
ncbi:MAG: hypothetical protein AB1393_11140 [Candidatus Edwardsbacteria bacterium]